MSEQDHIDGMGSAEHGLRKLAELAEEEQGVALFYAAERERLEGWWEDEQRRLSEARSFWELRLTQWHRAVLDETPHRKTITLPHGVLKSTDHKKPRLKISDPNAFVVWALTNRPELLRREEVFKPDRDAFLDAVIIQESGEEERVYRAMTKDGEPVDGVEIVQPHTDFKVVLTEQEKE